MELKSLRILIRIFQLLLLEIFTTLEPANEGIITGKSTVICTDLYLIWGGYDGSRRTNFLCASEEHSAVISELQFLNIGCFFTETWMNRWKSEFQNLFRSEESHVFHTGTNVEVSIE